MNKETINRTIRHLNIEIQNKRGSGYSYFTSTITGDQIGDSVMICYLKDQTVEEWADLARDALKSLILGGVKREPDSPEWRAATVVRKTLKLSGKMIVLDLQGPSEEERQILEDEDELRRSEVIDEINDKD